MRSFVKIKSSQNGEITLSTTDIVKSCSSRDFFYVASMSLNAIRENKNLAKISRFTVVAIFKGMVKTVLNGLFGICIRYKLCHMHVIMHSGDKFE